MYLLHVYYSKLLKSLKATYLTCSREAQNAQGLYFCTPISKNGKDCVHITTDLVYFYL